MYYNSAVDKTLFSKPVQFLERHAVKFLVGWILLLSVLYATLSIVRHNNFQSGGFDLGLYDQTVWQYSRFLYPYNTIKERFILGDHFTLTLPIISPLLYVWNNVRVLLVFQAVWLSISSLAVYLLAMKRRLGTVVSMLLAFLYSTFYGIQFVVYFDFHPVIIGVGLIAWLAYFLETGRKKLTTITIVLLLLTQENMGIALACLGCIYLFRKEYRKTALWFIIGGMLYSIVASKIIALFSPVGFQYWPQLSFHPVKILTQFFDSSEKQQVWLYSFAWFSFLPIFSAGALLAVFLDLAQYFVTGPEFARMWSPFMHHRAILAPFLTLGTLAVLVSLRNRKVSVTAIVVFMVLISLAQQYFFHFPLNKLSKAEYWLREPWMDNMNQLIASVPSGVSLATQQNLVPHVSHRKEIYIAWPRKHDLESKPCGEVTCWWLDFGGAPQFLLVDTRPNQWLTQILETNENWHSAISNMEKTGKITLERSVGDARLYRVHETEN